MSRLLRRGPRSPGSRAPVALAVLFALGALVSPDALAGEIGDLGARIEAFVRAKSGDPELRVELPDLADFEHAAASARNAEVRLTANPRTRMRGSVPITVTILGDGAEVKRGTVTARVHTPQRALVATRRLPRGTIVATDDLTEVPLERPLPRGAELRASELVGRRTVRSVAAGAVWRASFVERASLVSRGAYVKLVVSAGALKIEARGRSRENGGVGDVVRVLNVDSGREVTGRVAEDGSVIVSF